jgi:hypothetical protein
MNTTVLDNANITTCIDSPNVYNISAPRTFPKSSSNSDPIHTQEIKLPGSSLTWTLVRTPAEEECTRINSKTGECYINSWVYYCTDGETSDDDESQCCKYKVTGTGTGKALTVFNNPKTTDIKKTVVGNQETSLYNTLIPNDLLTPTPTDKKINAPESTHAVINTEEVGSGGITNPNNSIIRENNLAQDTMHVIQNCWLVPGSQQSSSKCGQGIVAGTCDGTRFKEIVGDSPTSPSSTALSYFETFILPNLTPEVLVAYSKGEEATGVPCEVLAGIHFEEGSNDPNKSLQDGRPLSGMSLIDSAIRAGQELNGKAGGEIADLNTLIMALSRYNGGGNSNCQPSSTCEAAASLERCGMTVACASSVDACGCASSPEPGSCRGSCGGSAFPWPISYGYCPPEGEGYDDPYVVNWWKSPQHDQMYLLYTYDCTQTPPTVHSRPGSLTVALSIYLSNQ